jgi:tetratricopeptide (TPR) repeat protein
MNQERGKINSPVLESAWQRYAEFDANSRAATRGRGYLLQATVGLAVIAVLLAVFIGSYDTYLLLPENFKATLRVILIVVLILDFISLAFTIRNQPLENAQVLRAAAEEIKKEIYFYRTVLQWHEERDSWLSQRLTEIQRNVADNFNTELTLKPYRGSLPPYYRPDNPISDPGFTRLFPDDYLRYRLEERLQYYGMAMIEPQQIKWYLNVGLFVTGGLSVLLATLGGSFTAWIALSIFAAAALIAWLEPGHLDTRVNTYNQLILALQIVRDDWKSLSREEQQTGEAFLKLVVATEKVIWSHYNKRTSEIWRAIDDLKGRKHDAFDEIMMLPAVVTGLDEESQVELATIAAVEIEPAVVAAEIVVEVPAKEVEIKKLETTLVPVPSSNGAHLETLKAAAKPKRGLPHAFVVMPFGRKQGGDGRWLDFNSIYNDLIKPALEAAGFESFRADEESVSGDILTDMFQELLLADLVIADLSIDNANVFYELGVRHAIRKRGVVHIQSGRAYMPFDIFNVRTIPYHIDKNGRPDPDHLEKDKQAITKITRETWASDVDRVHSPIFNLLDGLVEPDRKSLRTPLATGFWREYNEWRERMVIAQRQKRIGDILLLTEEISNPLIKEEAISEAGKALRGMNRHELALQQYRLGLQINPRNMTFRREEAFHLNRLNRTDEAIVRLENLLKDNPTDTEAISFLGRIYKQMWMETWVNLKDDKIRLEEAYNSIHWLIKSVSIYMEGFRVNINDYYPGINALTGSVLVDYMAHYKKIKDDPEIKRIREDLPKLKGAIHFVLESLTQRDNSDYWALVSLAELQVSVSTNPMHVTRAYKKALTAARKNIYNLKSSLSQLELLKSLGFRPEYVQAGVEVLQGEMSRIKQETTREEGGGVQTPPQVFIFSGHDLDRPDQAKQRLPEGMEKETRERIEKALEKFNADRNDMAITPGAAAGGDIIFLESCLKRNMKVEIYLPFQEARYIKEAISYAGDKWVERFYTIRNHPDVSIRLQPDHLGPVKIGDNVYERNERWALYSALIYGIDRARAIILWDGIMDEAPGGPDHMLEQVRSIGGIAEHLNSSKFDYWKAAGKVSRALESLTLEL